MASKDLELTARIDAARKAADRGRVTASDAERALDRRGAEMAQAIALTSIALSLSAMATVLLATLDEDASRG